MTRQNHLSQYYPKLAQTSKDKAGQENCETIRRQVSLDPKRGLSIEENNENYDLDNDELFRFTQQFNTFDDDEEEIADFTPEPFDFSQVEAFTQPEEDEIRNQVEDNNGEPSIKKCRIEHSSEREKMVDTDEINYLDTGRIWKVFKRGESFALVPHVGDADKVFTIQKFFTDRKLGKMAQCHISILAQRTFIGKDNDTFDKKYFEMKFGKYVRCRWSQDKPLKALKVRILQRLPEPILYYDPPPKGSSQVPGWTLAYSFSKCFSNGMKCIVPNKPAAIDLFAGAGGISIGLEKAGFYLVHVVDNDPMAISTLRLNHKNNTTVFPQDVEEYLEEAEHEGGQSLYKCTASHVHNSSPCQGFSKMNTTGSEVAREKKNRLCLTFCDAVIKGKRITGTFENVTGMLQKKRVHYAQEIIFTFLMSNYSARIGILNSAHYGTPQSRNRVIIFVSQKPNALPDLPKPTYGDGLLPVRTARDAIGDLEKVEPRERPGILKLPDSTIVDHHIKTSQEYSEDETLTADVPAHTVLCSHAIGHFSLPRACTTLEVARLQGFPDDWKFCGNQRQARTQIGNAVPIQLATAISKAVFDTCYEVIEGCYNLCWEGTQEANLGL